MNYMQAQRKSKIRFGEEGDALLMLIFINVSVFILLNFIQIVYVLSNMDLSKFESEVVNWVILPASLSTLVSRPWVLFTHMISHYSVWQMIGNMFFLWAFGYLLQDLIGKRHIVPLYIYGALAGAFLFLLSANLLPRFSAVIDTFHFSGASAAIMAIAIAATVTAPDYRVFPMINGGIPLWVITLIYVIIDFAGLASSSFPHHLSHLGGATLGFIYIKQVQAGNDPGAWMHRLNKWFFNLFSPVKKEIKKPIQKEVFYNTKGKEPFKKTPNLTEQRVDEILDKISQNGYQSLTQEEKDILKRASEKDV
jgi:membrane associated rhomboid family serine protease